jgi:potassium-transporting ATPase KdpC subunit
MINYFKPALILFILLTLLTGIAYPLLVTGLAQLIFPQQSNGSLLKDNNDKIIGSELIGQAFSNPAYFWGRPSATSPYAYNAGASGGSNFGPTNPALVEIVKARIAALQTAEPENKSAIPIDLVTASASGLDPHISPAAAAYQIKRIALSRNLSEVEVQKIIEKRTELRQWGLLGESRVNVLKLNHDLDSMMKQKIIIR